MNWFPLHMARREMRAGWRHTGFFLTCIALGVGAIVGVASLAENIGSTIQRDARELMGGDIEIRVNQPLREVHERFLQAYGNGAIRSIHLYELLAMALDPSRDTSQLVELKGIDHGYPFYGRLTVVPDRPLKELLGAQPSETGQYGVLVEEALLLQMDLRVGDQLQLGDSNFLITGIIHKEPDRIAGAFSLGPRVMISSEGLAVSNLVQPGSRIRHRYLLQIPPHMSPDVVKNAIARQLAGEFAQVKTYQKVQPDVQRSLEHMAAYLGFVGLVTLLVGGIGVAGSVRSMMRERLQTIAMMKCLGASSTTILSMYLIQALMLGLVGSVIGVILGSVIQWVLPAVVSTLLPVKPSLSFSAPAVAKGVGIGILVATLFAFWPLADLHRISPNAVFRRDFSRNEFMKTQSMQSMIVDKWGPAILLLAGLVGLALWQANSLTLGATFFGIVTPAFIALSLMAWGVMTTARRLPAMKSLAWRQGFANIHRPGSQVVPMIVSVGLGVMVILSIALVEQDVLRHIGEYRPDTAPSFFFIDIQPNQTQGFERIVEEFLHSRPAEAQGASPASPKIQPLIRSRLAAIDGTAISLDEVRHREDGWYFTREYVLTFMEDLPEDNILVRGEWWTPEERNSHPFISVEEDAAQHLGVDLGSTLEFDVQGMTVKGKIASIRRVDWNTLSTNFYMIFSPGSLDHAPMTYVGTIRVSPEDEHELQRAVTRAFPNITAIRIRAVIEMIASVIQRMSLAIQFMAMFCIIAGLIVLAGALATTKYQRMYEGAILKTLGSTRGVIARIFAIEYAAIGCVSGVLGVGLATTFSWALLRFVLDIPWNAYPRLMLAGVAATIVLTTAVGFLSTFRTLGHKPLAILRDE